MIEQKEYGRFDYFNEKSRKVLELAGKEAGRTNSLSITLGHLAAGFFQEEDQLTVVGNAVDFLHKLTAEEGYADLKQTFLNKSETPAVSKRANEDLTYADETDQAIDLAIEVAISLGHRYIATEHLLLGMLKVMEKQGKETAFSKLGITYEKVLVETKKII